MVGHLLRCGERRVALLELTLHRRHLASRTAQLLLRRLRRRARRYQRVLAHLYLRLERAHLLLRRSELFAALASRPAVRHLRLGLQPAERLTQLVRHRGRLRRARLRLHARLVRSRKPSRRGAWGRATRSREEVKWTGRSGRAEVEGSEVGESKVESRGGKGQVN